MKKLLAFTLSIIMMFSLCACGKSGKNEKICSSCGETISAAVAFCEHCGAATNNINSEENDPDNLTENNPSNQNENGAPADTSTPSNTSTPSTPSNTNNPSGTNVPSDTSTPADTSNPSDTSKPSDSSTPSTSTHSHSYSKKVTAATCTAGGYTTYTCSCGSTYKSDYTNPTHTYTKFICRPCGAIDKVNAYKYLVDYVKAKGTTNGSYKSITLRESYGKKYELKYDAQNQCLWATCREETQSAVVTSVLSLEDGYYGLNYVFESSITSDLTGFINPRTFNENSAMTYTVFTGLDSTKANMLNIARSSLVLTLIEMERYFSTNNVGLNVYALGYMGLQ